MAKVARSGQVAATQRAARRYASRADADDLAQDAAVALLERRVPENEWPRTAPAFARRIAANNRRKAKRKAGAISGAAPLQVRETGDTEQLLSAREALSNPYRAYAQRRFERSTHLRWTPVIESKFREWIPDPVDYREWNAQASMAKTLVKAIQDAQRWLTKNADRGMITPTIERIAEGLPMLQFFAKRRYTSDDKWMIGAIDMPTFLGLRRRPKLEELTCVSILLGHGVNPTPGEAPSVYFNRHRKRIRKARRAHPKDGLGADEYERGCKERGVVPVEWPPTETMEETEK